ncbi:autoinducer binding domain-containing protein [Brucellaceae bacterium C25G]
MTLTVMRDNRYYDAFINVGGDIDARIDRAFIIARELGFSALIYDYAPVATSPEGEIMVPNLLETRNLPPVMQDLWCGQGLHRHDPVQKQALQAVQPFFWSYHIDEASSIRETAETHDGAVARVLHEWQVTRGITVPLHMGGNRFASLTGLWGDTDYCPKDHWPEMSMSLLGLTHSLQDQLTPLFSSRDTTPKGIALSPREKQTIKLAAQGLSTKQISWQLGLADATVVMHLQSAGRKLGARNRVQAVALAAHYGFLAV